MYHLPQVLYNLSFDITDTSSSATGCNFTVEIEELVSSTGSIACNDSVNISLEDECEVAVTQIGFCKKEIMGVIMITLSL